MLSSLGKAQKGCSLQVKENSGRSLSRVWVNKEEEEKWPADRWKQNTSSAAQRAGDRGWEGMSRAVGLSGGRAMASATGRRRGFAEDAAASVAGIQV